MEQQELKVEDKRIPIPEETALSTDVQSDSFLTIFQIASQKNYDPAFIKEMMDLGERHEAREAKKAYVQAMANFKKNPPEIIKDKKVSYKAGGGTTSYSHASLANVTNKINAGLGEHGLSAAWETLQNEKEIKVTCTITHEMGHSESTSLTAAPDVSGSKNAIQAIGSTISYLERYTLLALTGLATHDMDDDGQATTVEYITDKQANEVYDLVLDTDTNIEKFCEYFGVGEVKELKANQLNEAMARLKKKLEK